MPKPRILQSDVALISGDRRSTFKVALDPNDRSSEFPAFLNAKAILTARDDSGGQIIDGAPAHVLEFHVDPRDVRALERICETVTHAHHDPAQHAEAAAELAAATPATPGS